MRCYAVITTENQQWSEIPDYGKVRHDSPLVIDDFRMIRIEAKRKQKFFEIPTPVGMQMTLHILGDDEELELTPRESEKEGD